MATVTDERRAASSFRALRHRNFRLYWTGQLVSLIGTWMQSVAQGWLMHDLTGSPLMLGLLGCAQFLPTLFLSLIAGVVADHVDKRKLLFVTQLSSLLQAAALAVTVSLGVVTPGIVLGLALAFGIINAFDLPLRQAIIAEMVEREDLSNAIALNSAAFNTARVVGPSIAGILLAVIGEAGCFWLNAVSFGPVLVSVVLMRFEPRRFAVPPHPFRAILEGVRYVRDIPSIRSLLVLLGVVSGFGFQYTTLLPVYAKDILDAGPQGYGLMVSAFGLGSLLSAVWMTRKMTRWDLRRNLLIGLLSSGLGMGLFAWSRWFPLTLAMGFLAGFGLILYVASTNMLLQITTEDRFRGRVMSIYTLMFIGTAPFGSLAAGWIAQHYGAPLSTSLSAVTLLGGALWVLYRLRVLAQRETPAPTEPVPSDKLA